MNKIAACSKGSGLMSSVGRLLRGFVYADKEMPMVIRVMKVIIHLIQFISYAAITCLMVLTVVDIVRRYVFSMAMNGVTEFSQMLLIISMTALAHALAEKRFVAVGEFVAKFPRWVDFAIELIMGIISFAFFVIVGWMLFGQIESSIKLKEAYFMIKVVKWPFYGVLGLAFASCALAVIVYVYERVVEFFRNAGEKSFIDEPELSILGLTEEDLKGKGDDE